MERNLLLSRETLLFGHDVQLTTLENGLIVVYELVLRLHVVTQVSHLVGLNVSNRLVIDRLNQREAAHVEGEL